ncbi:MAG: outer membrane lipoprotein carrier protein LolA [Bacteroidota bacterium]
MYRNIISLSLALIFGFSFAMGAGPDDKAKNILNQSKKQLEALNDFSANFTYVIKNPRMSNNPAARKGFLKYMKGMYAVMLNDQEIFCNKQYVWLHLKDEEEVSIMDYDASESFSVESIFDVYNHSGKAQYQGTESIGGASCHKIYMVINETGLGYNQATIWINTKTNMPVKVLLKDRNQTQTIYEFSNFKKNQGFSSKDFEFNVATFDGEVYDETE